MLVNCCILVVRWFPEQICQLLYPLRQKQSEKKQKRRIKDARETKAPTPSYAPPQEVLIFCSCSYHWCLCCWTQALGKYRGVEKETDMLLSTLSAMQEKAQHLEYNLSAETRIKLDLFSALGDARRQLEIAQGSLSTCLWNDSNIFTLIFIRSSWLLFCFWTFSE